MLWRYIKSQIWVLVCGGAVGPIFLVAYFATGQSPSLEWMFYVGLAVTALDFFIALALTNFGARLSAKTRHLEAQGVLALAKVAGIAETGTRINGRPLVKLKLHIEGPGIAPFETEDRVIASLTRLPMITSRKLVVLVDPANNEFRIDWERSALVSGAMPAEFTVAEDNRAYDLSGQEGPLMEILRILKANGIALNNMIDIRSNPAVRQQVTSVVRRAASQETPAPAPPAAPSMAATPSPVAPSLLPPSPEPSTAQRLQELETLRATGTISGAEYTTKRQQIISEL